MKTNICQVPNFANIINRLCRLKENRGATWKQISEDLGISLSMALMVKSGARVLGKDSMAKLEALEKKTPNVAPPPTEKRNAVGGRERVRLTEKDRERGFVEIDVSYRPGVKTTKLPQRIRISRPSDRAIEKVTKILGDTWEVKIVVLACLPETVANEDYLESLSTKSYLAVQSVALSLVIGERWRTLLAKAVVEGLIDTRSVVKEVVSAQG
jgi:hypothetical protein